MNKTLSILWLVGVSMTACIFVLALHGCVAMGNYKAFPNMVQLEVSFANALWDRKGVSKGQQGHRDNGKEATPSLVINNIPSVANAVILEFRDASVSHMNFGGRGKIGDRIQNHTGEVAVRSILGQTLDLPEGYFLMAEHVNPTWDSIGAYFGELFAWSGLGQE